MALNVLSCCHGNLECEKHMHYELLMLANTLSFVEVLDTGLRFSLGESVSGPLGGNSSNSYYMIRTSVASTLTMSSKIMFPVPYWMPLWFNVKRDRLFCHLLVGTSSSICGSP